MLQKWEDLSSPVTCAPGFAEQYERLEQLLDALKGPVAQRRKRIW